MDTDALLLGFIAITATGLVLIRTHIAFVILALCSGYVLSQFAGVEVFDFFKIWISPNEFPLYELISLTLLFLPTLMIAYRFRRTQTGFSRSLQQLLPAVSLTMIAAVFVVDIIAIDDSFTRDSIVARLIDNFSAFLIMLAIGVALFDVLIKHANEPIRRKRGPGRPKG